MLGSVEPASRGELTVLASGEETVFEAVRPRFTAATDKELFALTFALGLEEREGTF